MAKLKASTPSTAAKRHLIPFSPKAKKAEAVKKTTEKKNPKDRSLDILNLTLSVWIGRGDRAS